MPLAACRARPPAPLARCSTLGVAPGSATAPSGARPPHRIASHLRSSRPGAHRLGPPSAHPPRLPAPLPACALVLVLCAVLAALPCPALSCTVLVVVAAVVEGAQAVGTTRPPPPLTTSPPDPLILTLPQLRARAATPSTSTSLGARQQPSVHPPPARWPSRVASRPRHPPPPSLPTVSCRSRPRPSSCILDNPARLAPPPAETLSSIFIPVLLLAPLSASRPIRRARGLLLPTGHFGQRP